MMILEWKSSDDVLWNPFDRIFRVELTQNEGFVPRVTICLRREDFSTDAFAADNLFRLVAVENEQPQILVENARLVSVVPEGAFCFTVSLSAKRIDDDQAAALMKPLSDYPFHDAFFGEKEEPCESFPVFIDYDRKRQGYAISHYHQGIYTQNVSAHMDPLSVDVRYVRSAYQAIHLTLEAEWLQQTSGLLDVGTLIQQKCKNQRLETLTPEIFLNSWPQNGQWLQQDRLLVVSAALQEPQITPLQGLHGGAEWSDSHISKTSLRPELTVAWGKSQKRRERVVCVVENQVQKGVALAPLKKLFIRLGDISAGTQTDAWQAGETYRAGDRVTYQSGRYMAKVNDAQGYPDENTQDWEKSEEPSLIDFNPSMAHFFTTQRGKQAISHAISRAKTLLLASTRSVHVRVKIPYSLGMGLTTFHMLTIQNPRLPGGMACGKVVSYRIWADGMERGAEVTIACSVGTKEPSDQSSPQTPTEDLLEDLLEQMIPSDQIALKLMEKESSPSEDVFDWIEDIVIENEADTQLKAIEEGAKEGEAWSVKVPATQIHIHLAPQVTPVEQVSEWQVDHVISWSGPRQITLHSR